MNNIDGIIRPTTKLQGWSQWLNSIETQFRQMPYARKTKINVRYEA